MIFKARECSALLLLVGTVVGVGMFGIPFVFARAGFFTGLASLIGLTLAVTVVHLAYAEVVLRTNGPHRLPGYTALYLGPALGAASKLSYIAGLSGALLAYLVLGGSFLASLLQSVAPFFSPAAGSALFYLFCIAVLSRNARVEGAVNGALTVALILAVLFAASFLLPSVAFEKLSGFSLAKLFSPYGVIFFSLAGAAVIPEMRRLLVRGSLGRMRELVILGTLAPGAIYLLFAFAVVGVTGISTTPDAISGLVREFGPVFQIVGSIIGLLATVTSFIGLGAVLQGSLTSDFRFSRGRAFLLTALAPAILYLAGFQDFIAIISIVGAVAIGFDGILILFIHRRAREIGARTPEFSIALPTALTITLAAVFTIGILNAVVGMR